MMILSNWIFLLAIIVETSGFPIRSHSLFRRRKTSTDTSTTGRFSTISNGQVSPTSTVKIIKKFHPFSPPTWLQELPLHSPTIPPFFDDKARRRRILASDMTITRVSLDPPVFFVKNFCPDEKNNALMKYALENDLEYSGTSAGDIVKQRVGSYTGWVYPPDEHDKDEQDHMISKENNNIAKSVAGYMTELSRVLFVSDFLRDAMDQSSEESESYYSAEALQVVRYVIGGKYDVHHDGMNRFLTVLTYLNGVAGTWFPYAIVDNNQQLDAGDFEDLPNMSSGNAAHDKIPGKDGLLITNSPFGCGVPEDNEVQTCTNNILKIEKGDAIVFYNYDRIENPNAEEDMPQTGPIINWRSIHSGMRTTEEKWIATNWFYFHE